MTVLPFFPTASQMPGEFGMMGLEPGAPLGSVHGFHELQVGESLFGGARRHRFASHRRASPRICRRKRMERVKELPSYRPARNMYPLLRPVSTCR